jgi:hypothetical protein
MPIEVVPVTDERSYKKLVFALERFPAAFIATADDDVYYHPTWLQSLITDYQPGVIHCHRAHRVPLCKPLPPYRAWTKDVCDEAARQASVDLMPTGVGGILYPPGALHTDATDRDTYRALCPDADDIWFYWQARRAGSRHRKVGAEFNPLMWPGSQRESLFATNIDANDQQIANLIERYGYPLEFRSTTPDTLCG